MKKCISFIGLIVVAMMATTVAADSVFVYEKPKVAHSGKDLTPLEAYAMLKNNPRSTFVVDVRSRPEYQFVGHPQGAILVPLQFWTGRFEKKEYILSDNPEFGKDILARFNPETDTLLFICRSGTRAAMAVNAAIRAGWPPARAYNILGGFEGEKIKDTNSAFYGQRIGGGWRNEGLPWSNEMEPKLVY